MRKNDLKELKDMLSYARPSGSKHEKMFINKFLRPLGAEPDDCGNLHLTVGPGNPRLIFASHTDTVHTQSGRQKIVQSGDRLVVAGKKGGVLGSDDGAGVWIMIHLIRAEFPAKYIFHMGEEIGGRGSSWIADHKPKLIWGGEIMISLDRRGNSEVITHQMGRRCCSDEFASALALQIRGKYKPSDNGVFTDSANYSELISECTNLSVGYEGEHSESESLSISRVNFLKNRLLLLEEDKLPAVREPEPRDDFFCDTGFPRWEKGSDGGDIMDFVMQNPEIVSDFLDSHGISIEDISSFYSAEDGKREAKELQIEAMEDF